jgi:serine protease Do
MNLHRLRLRARRQAASGRNDWSDDMLSFRTRFLLLALSGCLALFLPGESRAQKGKGKRQDTPSSFTRNNFLSAFREVVAPVSKSTVRVLCDGKETSLGFIIESNGWILTKFNDLRGMISVKHGDRTYDANLVGVHKAHDLALLKIQAMGLDSVTLVDSTSAEAGAWVACVGPGQNPVAVGVVGVATRTVARGFGFMAFSPNAGYLGIQLDTDPAGVKVTQVVPKAAAEKAGLKSNDIIQYLDGTKVTQHEDFIELMQKQKAGDIVTLKVRRGDMELEFKPKLEKRPSAGRTDQNLLGSKLSSRRGGYTTILQHDSVVDPADCGGPIVDLEGRVIGINICRAGRVESYAVPSETIRPLLADLKSGKLPPPAHFAKELLQRAVKKAEATLKVAKAERAVAKAELDKLQAELEKAKVDNNIDAEKAVLRAIPKQQGELKTVEAKVNQATEVLEKAKALLNDTLAPKKDEKKSAAPLDPAARAALDRLVDAMGARLALMPAVARAKWNAGIAIDDAEREQAFLKNILGQNKTLDPDFTRRFFRRAA